MLYFLIFIRYDSSSGIAIYGSSTSITASYGLVELTIIIEPITNGYIQCFGYNFQFSRINTFLRFPFGYGNFSYSYFVGEILLDHLFFSKYFI